MAIAIWLISALQAFSLPNDLASSKALQNNTAAVDATYQSAFRRAEKLRENGRVEEAAALFERAGRLAGHDSSGASKAFLGAAGCQIRLFQYREALATSSRALQLAKQVSDYTLAGAAAGDQATIYYQLGDYALANNAVDQAVAFLEHSSSKAYLAQSLSMAGDVKFKLHDVIEATALFKRAIAISHAEHLVVSEGIAQDHLGAALLENGDMPDSERALLSAQRLFEDGKDESGLAAARVDLAELYLGKKQYPASIALVDKLLQSSAKSFIPIHWALQIKGRALVASGKVNEAIVVFNAAVESAERWRTGILLGDATEIRTAVSLSSVYRDYVETGANAAIANHNIALSYKVFEVLESSRSWELRDQRLLLLKQDMRLPPRYFQLLADLQETQALVTLGGNPEDLKDRTLHLGRISMELAALENKLGVPSAVPPPSVAGLAQRSSLRNIQATLNGNQLLLDFYLGESKSFLWAVTKDEVHLYELPPSGQVIPVAHAFSAMIQAEKVEQRFTAHSPAAELSDILLRHVPPAMSSKSEWLLCVGGEMLNGVPLSALPDPQNHAKLLIESRTLRFLPSAALLLTREGPIPHKIFIGVADPIYNFADSRRAAPEGPVSAEPSSTPVRLARLIGTFQEVQMSARSSDMPIVRILSGAKASVQDVRNALEKRSPAIVHFAVHVLAPRNADDPGHLTNSGQAALALSLTANGMPELLTKEMIATLAVPGSLVVLSACASEQGEIVPSAGIIGLSRAWLLAGASAVLVTDWNVPENSGDFFQTFYTTFRIANGSVSKRAAIALQKAQLKLRAQPGRKTSTWAAYSLVSRD